MTWEQESLLNDLLDCEDAGFTGWEMDFLDSLANQRGRAGAALSAKQMAVLDQIARKAGLIE